MGITVVGLGPTGWDSVDAATRDILCDSSNAVIVRTQNHPAAEHLASLREVTTCDDVYEALETFDAVYAAIVGRVLDVADGGSVVYAVPGSPNVGERSVPMLVDRAAEAGVAITVRPAQSFLDLVFAAAGIDPIADGVQVLDARDLPDPLPLHVPTIITQVDSPLRAADLSVALGTILEPDLTVLVLDRLGDTDEVVEELSVADVATYDAGPRTTIALPPVAAGLFGLIETNRILRTSCPWDMKQTHHSLLTHLVEEAYETADALGRLPMDAPGGEPDFGAYAEVEDELGDLLLQVLFHSTMAAEAGAFDIDEVAEINRRKLVRRHPHVFGDVDVADADEVLANWEQIKQEEKQRTSLMDDVPAGMPAVTRAMKVQKRASSVGFDWRSAAPVFDVLRSEVDELAAVHGDRQATSDELGDVLFTAINLARHLRIDPEVALRGSVDRFMTRFRHVEASFAERGESMSEATPDDLDAAWDEAKAATG